MTRRAVSLKNTRQDSVHLPVPLDRERAGSKYEDIKVKRNHQCDSGVWTRGPQGVWALSKQIEAGFSGYVRPFAYKSCTSHKSPIIRFRR